MNYLQYLSPVDTEVTIEKLDKVAKKLSDKIKGFAKFFGVVFGWCMFNLIVSMFFNRTRSFSLDAYRMISEGLRNLACQDILFILTLIFDNKFSYVLTMAMILAFGIAFFVKFLDLGNKCFAQTRVHMHVKSSQSVCKDEAYVVSYKQQVAFLA